MKNKITKEYASMDNVTLVCDGKSLSFYRPSKDSNYYFITADVDEQKEIETHPWFISGVIWLLSAVVAVATSITTNEGDSETETQTEEVITDSDSANEAETSDEEIIEIITESDAVNEADASTEEVISEGDPAEETVVTETPTEEVATEEIDEELLAVTSTQKASIYLAGKGIDMSNVGKKKEDVLAVAIAHKITFPNWI
ncbi:MAG: hypothetical protein A2W93_14345 [Bacteroidetes bacterium GWF2_43_63]|nr:MAG: hypothetical protein A2W94_00915 [Bacteroidetes bacterium GWE2_42_42]OFY52521.1 MAG: hypothetical protein A2W93_14345 [Bacteroidetes bacterium GWF2_43_63]HBG71428.1 hypothetical protein [Bacteroidales bacterium]HCB60820.1 hypothetical protein [Bacteroidales bacterium]HCY23455.1 hypothetical protein [Bacteroidales bacterium]